MNGASSFEISSIIYFISIYVKHDYFFKTTANVIMGRFSALVAINRFPDNIDILIHFQQPYCDANIEIRPFIMELSPNNQIEDRKPILTADGLVQTSNSPSSPPSHRRHRPPTESAAARAN